MSVQVSPWGDGPETRDEQIRVTIKAAEESIRIAEPTVKELANKWMSK